MKELTIVKIGGNCIDNEAELKQFISLFAKVTTPKVLIHGGGKLATQLSSKLGINTKMIEGRRVTDAETLKVATMVYAGWINKTIVAKLNAHRSKAVGLCGADAFIIPSVKRKKKNIDYGFVGDVQLDKIDTALLRNLLRSNITPVIAPITSNYKGDLLNTNADTIAAGLAIAFSKHYKVNFIYCFEKDGVLKEEKVIKRLNKQDYIQLKDDGIIKDGMIPKLDNAFSAMENGVKKLTIGKAQHLTKLLKQNAGTAITK